MGHWLAYEFVDQKGRPVFVGINQRGDGPMFFEPRFWPLYEFFECNTACPYDFVERVSGEHPAERQFRSSKKAYVKSELLEWLASQGDIPTYRTLGEGSRSEVRAIQRKRRLELERQGVTMLSGKLTKKIIKDAKRVWNDGQEYQSVRAAAAITGIPRSTISRWCNSPDNREWGFIE